MQCTSCSADLDPGSSLCPYCGTPVRSTTDSQPPAITNQHLAPAGSATVEPAETFSDYTAEEPLLHSPANFSEPTSLEYSPILPTTPSSNAPAIVSTPLPHARRRFHLALLLLPLIILLLIAEAIGISYYFTNYHPTALKADATTVSKAVITATYNDPHTLYTLVTNQPATITQSLDNTDNTIWDSTAGDSNSSCLIKTGAYHVSISQQGYIMRCGLPSDFSNFAFQVQIRILSGTNGGILFRYDPTNNQYYRIQISPQGQYRLYTYDQQRGVHVLQYGQISTFNTGLNQPNLVTVIAQGSKFFIYVNKHFVTSTTDKSYPEGTIALSAVDDTSPTEVAFNNAQIWILA